MKNYKNIKLLALLVFLGITLFVIFVYLVFSSLSSVFTSNTVPTSGPEFEEKEPEKILEIISLKDKTPYYGRFFSLTFDENEGFFNLYIDPGNSAEGNREFEQFLRQNGIFDRSQFPFLQAVDAPPTP